MIFEVVSLPIIIEIVLLIKFVELIAYVKFPAFISGVGAVSNTDEAVLSAIVIDTEFEGTPTSGTHHEPSIR